MNAFKRAALFVATALVVGVATPGSAQTSAHGHKQKKQSPAHKHATHNRKAAAHTGSQNLGNTDRMAQRPYEMSSKGLKAADRQLQQLSHDL